MVMFSSRAPQSAVVGWALACLDSDNQWSKFQVGVSQGESFAHEPWSYPQISISKAKNNNERRGRFRHGMETSGPKCFIAGLTFVLGSDVCHALGMCNDIGLRDGVYESEV